MKVEKIPNNWNLESILALTYVKGLSYARHKQIIERYGSFDEFSQNAFDVNKGFFDKVSNEYSEKAKEQIDFCEKNNINIISIWNESYPKLLKSISYPPTILFVKGKLQNSDSMSISVVGTRKCTTYGKLSTETFVSEFVKNNVIVTSGLANGIDTIAHKTAIKHGGVTYAVIASGVDKILPNLSNKFAEEIVESGGAIISEYKCGTLARPIYFPQRNRIVSGISKATLITESAAKGGSLITAKFAADQGREVFAIPGNISYEQSLGCNLLIHKNIAAIAVSPKMMLKDLGLEELFESTAKESIKLSNSTEKMVYEVLSHEPIHIDMLIEKTGLEIQELLVILLQLEFNDLIRQLPGKYYIKFII